MTDSVEALLQPGKSSGSGFLGRGESFEEVVRNDSQTLTELGLQHKDIAERLQYIVSKASQKCGDISLVDDKYKVRTVSWLGYQNCPWQDEEKTDKDYFIENIETGRKILFSGLMPHLVGDHHFFEGRGTRYRLDPLETILVLDIETANASTADVEERLFGELTSDLESQYKDARVHALKTLSWFREKEDLPQYVSKFIQNLRASANDEDSNLEFRDYVKLLIDLGSTLPEETGRQVNPQIYGLLDVLNKNNDICGFVKRDLMKFKREVE